MSTGRVFIDRTRRFGQFLAGNLAADELPTFSEIPLCLVQGYTNWRRPSSLCSPNWDLVCRNVEEGCEKMLGSKQTKYRVVLYTGILFLLIFSITRIYVSEDDAYVDYTRNMIDHDLLTCSQTTERAGIIEDFSQLMKLMDIKVVLLEPTILYCLLNEHEQDQLLRKGYNGSKIFGSSKVLNFGTIDNKGTISEKLHVFQMPLMGFELSESRTTVQGNWFSWWSTENHVFFRKDQWLIHLVFFQKRGSYIWHAGLQDDQFPAFRNETDVHFTRWNSVYDMFYPVRLADTNVFIPSNPSYFLHQMSTSKFVECLGRPLEDRHRNGRYQLLKNAFVKSLTQLKKHLQPLHITVVIFGGTLLGWYRECDLIPYTSDVDFAASASNVENEEFWLNAFQHNVLFKIHEIMGVPEEGYELTFRTKIYKTDLFFLYENGSTLWSAGHRPSKNYYFRYTYPNFELCSADLLGFKVQVPCTPEQVLAAEYGPNWMTPVHDWDYEKSPFNTGPKIYWPNDKKDSVYQHF